MPRIQGDRTELDRALGGLDKDGNVISDVLVLFGGAGSQAERVYVRTESMQFDTWERVFLIENVGDLTLEEHDKWFGNAVADAYAVVRVGPKSVHPAARTVDDLMINGNPHGMRIRLAFSNTHGVNP